MFLTTRDLDQKLKTGYVNGVYLFYGEEAYLKRYYLDKFRKICCPDPDLEVFNHAIVQGGDLAAFERELAALPLFGSGRLVELRDTDFNKIKSDDLTGLCDLLTKAEDITVLIDTLPEELPVGTSKRPSPQLAALAKVAGAVNFERQTPQKLTVWIGKHFAAEKIAADPEVCRMLIDLCSPDMFILASEIDKLAAYLHAIDQDTLTPEIIRQVASPNKIFGAFDFANAILAGDTAAALSVFADMRQRRERPENILGTLSRITGELLTVRTLCDQGMAPADIGAALKLSDYPLRLRITAAKKSTPERLKAAFDRCAAADLLLKSSSLPGYALIERLILFEATVSG